MTPAEFEACWSKVVALWPRAGTPDYRLLCWDRLASTPAPLFQKAVDLMIDSREERTVPSIPEWKLWLARARESVGLGADKSRPCPTCSGDKFVPGSYLLGEDVIPAVRPCPTCNSKYWPIRPDKVAERLGGAICLAQPVEIPTASTIRFVNDTYGLKLDPEEPGESFSSFLDQLATGELRVLSGSGAFGRLIGKVKTLPSADPICREVA